MSDKYIPLSKNGLQLQKTKNTKYDGQMRLKNTWEQSGGMLQPSHESPPSRPQAMTFSQGQLSFHNLTIHSATSKAHQGVDELMKTGVDNENSVRCELQKPLVNSLSVPPSNPCGDRSPRNTPTGTGNAAVVGPSGESCKWTEQEEG